MSLDQIQVELQEWMGSDAAIANAAWTSTYNKERREGKYDDPEKVERIVRFCIESGHSVPVESVVLRFWIRWPVFADRQHMTHRIASHNGLSGRYRTLPSDYYTLRDDNLEVLRKAGLSEAARNYDYLCERAHEEYSRWLRSLKEAQARGAITNAEYKSAREVLRGVLPTSFMVERTTIFNLGSFANYQRLRNSDHAQPEIRHAAKLMLAQALKANIAPVAFHALAKRGWLLAEPNYGATA